MIQKYIVALLFILKTLIINAQEVKFSLGRFLNFEAARWTLVPRYAPLLHSPLVPMEVLNNKVRMPHYNHVDGLLGADLHYYAPNSRLTFGSYVDVVRQQLTIQDANHPTFTTVQLELKPYFHFKTGDFTQWFHVDMNAGLTVINALSRSVVYFDQGQRRQQSGLNTLSTWKLGIFAGGGITIDLAELDKKEDFLATRVRLFTAGLQWNLPIPYTTHSNFFKKRTAFDNSLIDNYRSYSAKGSYFTFTLGTKVDLFDYYYRGNWDNPAFKDKKAVFLLHPPHYFKEPIKNQFGGFHIDLSVQPALDSTNYKTPNGVLINEFRNMLNYGIGYNYHFLGNYDLDQQQQSNQKYNLFAGLQVQNRNFIPENDKRERYHTTALGLNAGGRIGVNGWYLLGGGELNYYFINDKWVDATRVSGGSLFKSLDYTFFGGISFRNVLSIKVKRNPLFGFVPEKSGFKSLEWWISMGF
jgi:hypothetical protein